jgi:hypothetical protein
MQRLKAQDMQHHQQRDSGRNEEKSSADVTDGTRHAHSIGCQLKAYHLVSSIQAL